jgi:hypothetical protein
MTMDEDNVLYYSTVTINGAGLVRVLTPDYPEFRGILFASSEEQMLAFKMVKEFYREPYVWD